MFPVSGAEQFVASAVSGAAAHDLAQRRVLEVGEPRALSLSAVGEEEVPEAARARLGLQVLHHRR